MARAEGLLFLNKLEPEFVSHHLQTDGLGELLKRVGADPGVFRRDAAGKRDIAEQINRRGGARGDLADQGFIRWKIGGLAFAVDGFDVEDLRDFQFFGGEFFLLVEPFDLELGAGVAGAVLQAFIAVEAIIMALQFPEEAEESALGGGFVAGGVLK